MEQKNILILGAPRSGTSLLASMLSKHTDASILYEDYRLAHTRIIAKKLIGNKLCIPSQIEVTKKRKRLKSMIINFLLEFKPLSQAFRKYRYPLSYYSINDYLQLNGIRIVIILRNGNDVIDSNMRRGSDVSFKYASYWWKRAIDITYELWLMYPDKVYLVEFDDLVTNPMETIQGLSEFIGLDFQSEMLDGYKHTPIYEGRDCIDPRKAYRNNCTDKYHICDLFPDQYSKYIEMIEAIANS